MFEQIGGLGCVSEQAPLTIHHMIQYDSDFAFESYAYTRGVLYIGETKYLRRFRLKISLAKNTQLLLFFTDNRQP